MRPNVITCGALDGLLPRILSANGQCTQKQDTFPSVSPIRQARPAALAAVYLTQDSRKSLYR